MDPDELFVQGAAQNRAKVVCATCPVRTECLADALDNRVEYGVWGGMTERERRALLRRRPGVRSWRQVLEEKRDAYLRQTGTVLMMPPPQPLLPRQRETLTGEADVDIPIEIAVDVALSVAVDVAVSVTGDVPLDGSVLSEPEPVAVL